MGFWLNFKKWLFGLDIIAVEDLKALVDSIDKDKNGFITLNELFDRIKEIRL